MVTFTFKTPPGFPRGPVVLVLVLEKENLERMKLGDPFDLQLNTIPAMDRTAKARELDVVIAYEEDLNKLMAFRDDQDIDGLMSWLERGRKITVGDLLPMRPLRKV